MHSILLWTHRRADYKYQGPNIQYGPKIRAVICSVILAFEKTTIESPHTVFEIFVLQDQDNQGCLSLCTLAD